MQRLLAFLLLVLALQVPSPVFAQQPDPMEALRVQDFRLLRIAERMMRANAPLCLDTMPLTGLLLHSADQYAQSNPEWFANGSLSIAGVLPGSPAALAGIQQDEAIIAIGGTAIAALPEPDENPLRDAAFALLAEQPGESPLALTIRRDGGDQTLSLSVPYGCRALVEILTENGTTARSDGRVIQISYGLADRLNDDQLAVIFAHELAHAVLRHRVRLEEAGVRGGLLGEFGRDRRLGRQVEVEADLLSPHLLANAGYDPDIASRFWRSEAGDALGGGIFRSRVYPSRTRRAEAIEQEIARYLAGNQLPSTAEHLLRLRDQPFAG